MWLGKESLTGRGDGGRCRWDTGLFMFAQILHVYALFMYLLTFIQILLHPRPLILRISFFQYLNLTLVS